MNRDNETLLDIAKSARLVIQFAQGLTLDDFIEDLRTQGAVLYHIEVIGEAVKRLSFSFREEHTAIPWALIAGMRDNLIHDYNDVDLDLVWDTVEKGVPELLRYIEPLLPQPEQP